MASRSFVAQPPYAEDPLLRDTFEKQRPLLSAEAGLTKLTRYLSLTKLDDAVKTSALPFGEHHDSDVRRRGQAHQRRSSRISSPWCGPRTRVPRTASGPPCASLELVVCDQLVLEVRVRRHRGDPRGRSLLHRQPPGEAWPPPGQRRHGLPRARPFDGPAALVSPRSATRPVPERPHPVGCLHHAAHCHLGRPQAHDGRSADPRWRCHGGTQTAPDHRRRGRGTGQRSRQTRA